MAFFGPPPPFTGATTANAGASGLVPAPSSGTSTRLLYSDSTFKNLIILPQYKPSSTTVLSNPYIGFGTSSVASLAPTDKVRTFSLLYIPATGNINTLIARTSTAPSTAYNIHIGVWEVGDDGQPSTYITGATGSSGTTGSTDIEISITSIEIKIGWLFFSITPDATQAALSITTQSNNSTAFIRRQISNSMSGLAIGGAFTYTCLSSYSQTTHETFVISSNTNPMLGFKYA